MTKSPLDDYLEKTAASWGSAIYNNVAGTAGNLIGHGISGAGSLARAAVGSGVANQANLLSGGVSALNSAGKAVGAGPVVPKSVSDFTTGLSKNLNDSVGGAWQDTGTHAVKALTNDGFQGFRGPATESASDKALAQQRSMDTNPVTRAAGQAAMGVGETAANFAMGGGAAVGGMRAAGVQLPKAMGLATQAPNINAGVNAARSTAGAIQTAAAPVVNAAKTVAAPITNAAKPAVNAVKATNNAMAKVPGGRTVAGLVGGNAVYGTLGEGLEGSPEDQPQYSAEEQQAPRLPGQTEQPSQPAQPEDGPPQLSEHTAPAVAEAEKLVQTNPEQAKTIAAGAEQQIQEKAQDPAIKPELDAWQQTGQIGTNLMTNAYEAISKLVQDPSQIGEMFSKMSPAEIVGMGLGLTTAAMGVMHLLSGKGGLGSIIATVAGLGTAAGAFGNANGSAQGLPHGPGMGSMQDSMMSMLGMGAQTKANTQDAAAAGAVQPTTNSPQSAQGTGGGAQSDTQPIGGGQPVQQPPSSNAAGFLDRIEKDKKFLDPAMQKQLTTYAKRGPWGYDAANPGSMVTQGVRKALADNFGVSNPQEADAIVEEYRRRSGI